MSFHTSKNGSGIAFGFNGETIAGIGSSGTGVLDLHGNTINAEGNFRADSLESDTIAEDTAGAGVTADSVKLKDGGVYTATGKSAAAGQIAAQFGSTLTEGINIKVLDEVVACTQVENAMTTAVPKGGIILGVLANCDAALTGGGTTVTWSVGINGDVDKYGTAGFPTQADLLTKNSKSNFLQNLDTAARLAADETILVCAAATGGASAGNTALTVGSVRVQVTYLHWDALDNAA